MAAFRPERILEVGTAVGFSALLMSEYNPVPCQIVTIENYEKRIPVARENFQRAGREEQIRLIAGDAADILKTLDGPFDFIFMDAAKGQYINFLPDILESKYAVERRNRTIYKRMREYLYELKHNEMLITSLIPLGDGVALSTKR